VNVEDNAVICCCCPFLKTLYFCHVLLLSCLSDFFLGTEKDSTRRQKSIIITVLVVVAVQQNKHNTYTKSLCSGHLFWGQVDTWYQELACLLASIFITSCSSSHPPTYFLSLFFWCSLGGVIDHGMARCFSTVHTFLFLLLSCTFSYKDIEPHNNSHKGRRVSIFWDKTWASLLLVSKWRIIQVDGLYGSWWL